MTDGSGFLGGCKVSLILSLISPLSCRYRLPHFELKSGKFHHAMVVADGTRDNGCLLFPFANRWTRKRRVVEAGRALRHRTRI